jgi:AcrR family transcriptional regulator
VRGAPAAASPTAAGADPEVATESADTERAILDAGAAAVRRFGIRRTTM